MRGITARYWQDERGRWVVRYRIDDYVGTRVCESELDAYAFANSAERQDADRAFAAAKFIHTRGAK